MHADKAILYLFAIAGIAFAQTPAFEVASIKTSAPITPASFQSGKVHIGVNIDGARVDIGSMPLTQLIMFAYRVKQFQVTGPDWLRQERFDILAKIPEGASKDQVPEMLQALLAERFKLTIHRENKEQPVYGLVVGKNGPKLKEAAPEPDTPAPAPPPDGRGAFSIGTAQGNVQIQQNGRGAMISGGPMGPMKVTPGQDGHLHMEFAKTKIPAFTDILTGFVDRPVVDMTELKGTYQITLELSMEEMMNMARARAPEIAGQFPGPPPGAFPNNPNGVAASDPSGGGIFQAVQQLGLKLDPRKMPVETIVVDHAEKTPTEN